MTLITTDKPLKDLYLPLGVWTTVTIARCPLGWEQAAYNYVKVYGRLRGGEKVCKIRVRALRNGITEGFEGFDETANDDRAGIGPAGGEYSVCIPTPWLGARRQDTLYWQVKPSWYAATAWAGNSRHETGTGR